MRSTGWRTLCLMLVCLGCSGKPEPAVSAAAEKILKAGGTFVVQGYLVPVKSGAKIPPGKLPIVVVDLNRLKATDEQVEALKSLQYLEELRLEDSQVTDAGLAHLMAFKQLQIVDLHKSQKITDKGIESLKALPKLSKLELSYTRLGDGAVDSLLQAKQLKVLHLTGTRVTSAGLKKLRDGLPGCEVLK